MLQFQKKQPIALYFMYLISTFVTIYFLTRNKIPLAWDQSGYLDVSAQMGHSISNLDFLSFLKLCISHEPWSNRPGLFMVIGGIFASVTNFDVNLIVLFSNMFWVGLTIFGTYSLSEHFKSRSGLLSVFLLLSSYSVIVLYRDYLTELPLMATVILVQYSFFKSDNLMNLKGCIFTFIFMIMGALIKETFVLYVFPLFIYSTVRLFYNKEYKNKVYLINYLLTFFLSFLIILCFYIPILSKMLRNALDNVGSEVGQYYSRPYTKGSINYYLIYLYNFSFVTSIFYIIIPSITFFLSVLCTKKKISLNINGSGFVIFLLIFLPLVVLTFFVVDTDYRFIVPLLPLLLVCCSICVQDMQYKLKSVIISMFLIIGILNVTTSIIPIKIIPESIQIGHWVIFNQGYYAKSSSIRYGLSGIQDDYYQVMNETISSLKLHVTKGSKIGVLVSKSHMNTEIFNSYAALNNENFKFFTLTNMSGLKFADYIITTDSNLISEDPKTDITRLKNLNNYLLDEEQKGEYALLKSIKVPDGSHLLILDTSAQKLNPIKKETIYNNSTQTYGLDIFEVKNNKIKVQGWSFLNGAGMEKETKYIILTSIKNNQRYIYMLKNMKRHDITIALEKQTKKNLDNSGFVLRGQLNGISPGAYKVQLYNENSLNGALIDLRENIKVMN